MKGNEGVIKFWRVSAEELVARVPDDYVATGMEEYLAKKMFGSPLLLKGPKGAGKTMGIEKVLADRGICMVRHPCTEDDTARTMFGSRRVDGDFQLGPVTSAIDVANSEGGCALVLEEINALSPRTQKALNSVTDYRREVQLAGIGKTFRLNPGAHLWVVGTANPNYAGTYDLNEDLISRFTVVDVGYMSEELEKKALLRQFVRYFEREPKAVERVTVGRLVDLATYTRTGTLKYALSTRELVDIVRSWSEHGTLGPALRETQAKYDADAVPEFQTHVQTTFEIDLKKVVLWTPSTS